MKERGWGGGGGYVLRMPEGANKGSRGWWSQTGISLEREAMGPWHEDSGRAAG